MTRDKNGVELKAGDVVRFEGVVGDSESDIGFVFVEWADGLSRCVAGPAVEFVSRPAPTVSVELTLAEIRYLRSVAACRSTYPLWVKLNDICQEIDNEA